jgi:hypothetical protein
MPVILTGTRRGFTTEGGTVHWFANGSPAPLTKGSVVKPSNTTDDNVILTALNDVDPIGIVYEDIPIGQSGWVVTRGIADVLLDNAAAVGQEWWVGTSGATVGQCTAIAVPPGAVGLHFQETGHTIRAKGVGAGLCRCMLHWN